MQAALADLHAVDSDAIVDRRAQEALTALDVVNSAPVTPPANGAAYPASGRGRDFGRVLAQIAALIRADVGLEAVATEANFGWDLHENFGEHDRRTSGHESRCARRGARRVRQSTSARTSTASPWC